MAPLQRLETRRREEVIAEVEELHGRHRLEYGELVDQDAHDLGDPMQPARREPD